MKYFHKSNSEWIIDNYRSYIETDVFDISLFDKRDNDRQTALFRRTNPECDRALFSAGIDVNARDKHGQTAVFSQTKVLEYLSLMRLTFGSKRKK